MHQPPNLTLTSLYSSGQCLLSVLGSIGVILLFAGIPQLIYAPQLSPGSLMTFLLGAVLISLMVAGNAFISYKYRQMVRSRQEADGPLSGAGSDSIDDKPPSYDDLIEEEGLPPSYAAIVKEKPPRYEELVTEVFNWSALTKAPESYCPPCADTTQTARGVPSETPILVSLCRHLSDNCQRESPILQSETGVPRLETLSFQESVDCLQKLRRVSNPSMTLADAQSSLKQKKMASSASMPDFKKVPQVHCVRKQSAKSQTRKDTIIKISELKDSYSSPSRSSRISTSRPTSSVTSSPTSSPTSPTSTSYSSTSTSTPNSSTSSSSNQLHTSPSNLSTSSSEPESSNL